MTDITPNHLHIYRDRRGKHITLDGQDLLLDGEDPMLITGMENQDEVTRVMLTLLAPKITVDSEIEDREPEPATVDAPEPALAEELRDTARWWREGAPTWEQCCDRFESLAARAEQIEQERDQALAEVERLTAERDREKAISKGWMEAHQKLAEHHAETLECAVQKGAESNAETTDPADVKPGEAWVVECRGERRTAVKDNGIDIPWNTINADGWYLSEDNEDVTPITRMVPVPRAITNPDELDRLAEGTIVRDKDGDAWQRTCDEWTTAADYGRFTSWAVSRSGPVTVLWEPEA